MIGEHEVAELLRAAADEIAVPLAPARELAAAGSRRRHRRRVGASVAAATAVAALVVGTPVVLSSQRSQPVTPSTVSPGAGCVEPVPSRVLPGWARAGFSGPNPRIAYVLGDRGDIAALLFAQPLTAPPSADHNNKILWVSRAGVGTLHITATLRGGSATATRVVDGGPGPSIIDLPRPGCWHFTLRWAGNTDSLDLAYLTP